MKNFKLDNHPKITTGFKTPEGYFDSLSDRIADKFEENNTAKIISFASYRKKILYAAAAVFVLSLSIPLITNILQNPKALTISTDSIEDYLSASENVSSQDFSVLLTEEDIQNLEVDLKIDNKEIETLLTENDYLENYLID